MSTIAKKCMPLTKRPIMKLGASPCDHKGAPEDQPQRKKRGVKMMPPVSEFEQLRRDTLGAQDRSAYIQGVATQRNRLSI